MNATTVVFPPVGLRAALRRFATLVAALFMGTASVVLAVSPASAAPAVAPAQCTSSIWINGAAQGLTVFNGSGQRLSASRTPYLYGDIAFTPDGALYGARWDSEMLDRLNPQTGAVEASVALTGPVALVSNELNALGALRDGTLLGGYSLDSKVYAIDPVTGESSIFADTSALGLGGPSGDFFEMADGSVLGVFNTMRGTPSESQISVSLVRFTATGDPVLLGQISHQLWGGARSGASFYFGSPDNHLYRLDAVPSSYTEDIPVTDLGSINVTAWGGASPTDTDVSCGPQDPPVASDDAASTTQGVPVSIDVLANDTAGSAYVSLDPASTLLQDPRDGSWQSTVVTPGGSWMIDGAGVVTFVPNTAFVGSTVPVTYRVQQSDGQIATAAVQVSVQSTPGSGTDAVNDSADTVAGRPVTLDVLANDSADIDPASVRLINPASGQRVRELTTAGGSWSVDPATGVVTFSPRAGFVGTTLPLSYEASTSAGVVVTANLAVNVSSSGPSAVDDVATTTQATPVALDVLANDSGAGLDPTSVRLLDPASGASVAELEVPGEGLWSLGDGEGQIVFSPEPDFRGAATPQMYVVSNDNGERDQARMSVTVVPVVPNAIPDEVTVPGDTSVTLAVLNNDIPGSAQFPIDPTTLRLVDPVTGAELMSYVVDGEGTWTVDLNDATITFTPAANFVGLAASMSYAVADINGTRTTTTMSVAVGIARAQANPDDAVTLLNTPVSVSVLLNDEPSSPDVPFDPATLVLYDPVSNSDTTLLVMPQGTYIAGTDGTVLFTPNTGFFGYATPVQYTVTDAAGVPSSSTISVSVSASGGGNDTGKPIAVPDAGITSVGIPVTVDLLGNDFAGSDEAPLDPLSVTFAGVPQPVGATVSEDGKGLAIAGQGAWVINTDGTATFVPEPGFVGQFEQVRYTVFDSDGVFATSTLDVAVLPGGEPGTDNGSGTGGSGTGGSGTGGSGAGGSGTGGSGTGGSGASGAGGSGPNVTTVATSTAGSRTSIAYTGVDAAPIAIGAAVLLLVGVGSLAAARRTRHHPAD